MDRVHDPIERNLGVLAAVSNQILGGTAEQEERHPVGWNQDAAEVVDLIGGSSETESGSTRESARMTRSSLISGQ
jgi:hypothetical protein